MRIALVDDEQECLSEMERLCAIFGQTGGDSRFIPVNKGIAVNAEYILEFERGCCIMESGIKFPVRVRDSARIEQMAWDYHFKKIRERQAHSTGRSVPNGGTGRKGDHERL